MGSERLIRLVARASLVVALAAAPAVGCAPAPPPAAGVASRDRPRHLEIIRAMKTPERRALVERFREQNPAPDGAAWVVNEEALGRSLTVVEPFAGFLRRARLERGAAPGEGRAIEADEAAASARAFVAKNAELFGLPRPVALGLAEAVRRIEPRDHAGPRAAWAVRFDATFSSRGYEAFHELDNAADVEVFVDDDGAPSAVVNLSRVHPQLTIDTRPRLGREDPQLFAHLVGRTLFALVDDGHSDLDLQRHLRALRRIPLGSLRREDIQRTQLVIHASAGPELAWLTYRLGYFVEVAKRAPPRPGPADAEPPGSERGERAEHYFFRYVIDADTGEVVEDARAPVAPPDAGALSSSPP